MARTYFTIPSVVVLVTSCKGPAPPSPAELARSAAKARAAAAQSSAPPAPAPALPEPEKPVLTLQDFTRRVPAVLCSALRGGVCALDVVGKDQAQDLTVVKRGQETMLIGWAADVEAGMVPPVVLVQLAPPSAAKPEDKKAPAPKEDKKVGTPKPNEVKTPEKAFFAAAVRITKRRDVAEAHKVPVFVHSGYDVLASFKNLPPGEYSVSIVQVTANGQALVCDTTRRLKIE